MQSLLSIIPAFCLDLNKLNKTGTQMLDLQLCFWRETAMIRP